MKSQQPQRVRKRQAIIDASRKLFLKQGYKAASMDGLAAEAGVSKRTIYQHFKTKSQLFQEIIVDYWHSRGDVTEQLSLEVRPLKATLTHFATTFLDFIYQDDTIALFRLLIEEAQQFPDMMSKLLVNGKAPFTRALITYLNQQKDLGKVSFTSAERSASYFIGMLKEYHFWPMMMGFETEKKLEGKKTLIKEVVDVFCLSIQC